MVDVLLPTDRSTTLRRRCVSHPTDHQAILLHRLNLPLPRHLPTTDVGAETCSGNSP